MKLIQFILIGVCMSMLFSSVGATTVYFGHLGTRVGVEVANGDIESLQQLIDHNQFSAPAAIGCGEDQCISSYQLIGEAVQPTCVDILHFSENGTILEPRENFNIQGPQHSQISNGQYDNPQKEFELTDDQLPILSPDPLN